MSRFTSLLQTVLARRTAVVLALGFVVYLFSSGMGHTVYDNYVRMADAWLHGQVDIPRPPPYIDAIVYGGRYYLINAPLPAVLMLPFVALFGSGANQSLVVVACAAIALAAADVLLGRLNLDSSKRIVLLLLFGFGTVLWWCASFGAVWMFEHVSAVMFVTMALAEWYGARRPWLLGLLLACAALCRLPLALAIPPVAVWLWLESRSPEGSGRARGAQFKSVAGYVAGVAPLFALYAAYNWLRWHTVRDIGYMQFYHQDTHVGSPTGSPFALAHLPFNLYSWFMLAPSFGTEFPWFKPTSFGVSLTLTSPALALAFLAPLRNREALVLWCSIALVSVPSLLYFVNGFEQFGVRYTLDFMPFAIVLVARGVERAPQSFVSGIVGYSILANAYGVWYSWAYHAFAVVPWA